MQRENTVTMRRMGTMVTLLLLSVLAFSCKKKEEEIEPQPKGKKRQIKPKKVENAPERLSEDEQKAIAKQRLYEALKERKKPFDRITAVRDVIFKKYQIDINEVFEEEKLKEVESGGDLRYLFRDLKSADEVRAILEDEAAKAIEPNWPDERLERVKKAADEKFKHFKQGEVIEVKTKTPNSRTIKDVLRFVRADDIVVGTSKIPYQDLSYPPKWAFDERAVARKKRDYISGSYYEPKGRDKVAAKEKMEDAIYKKYGCVKVGKKWVSIKRLFVKEIEPSLDELEAKHDKKETERLAQEIYLEMLNEGLLTK